jgi:hypothetical protein
MHKKISGRLAIEIIFLLSVLVGGYALFNSGIWSQNDFPQNAPSVKTNNAIATPADSCKTHAYQGEAKISGWYVNDGNEWLLVVSDEDMGKLPNYDGTEEYKLKNKKIKLIDVTSQTEKKLKLTSEKKPQIITITGYVMRCGGVPLASIEYKEGIFKKYMDI